MHQQNNWESCIQRLAPSAWDCKPIVNISDVGRPIQNIGPEYSTPHLVFGGLTCLHLLLSLLVQHVNKNVVSVGVFIESVLFEFLSHSVNNPGTSLNRSNILQRLHFGLRSLALTSSEWEIWYDRDFSLTENLQRLIFPLQTYKNNFFLNVLSRIESLFLV